MAYDLLDHFAGPGGWDEGGKSLGVRSYGVEIDADACATAKAAGHSRLHADVLDVKPEQATAWTRQLFVASPPCVAFSKLNKGHARKHVDELCDAVRNREWGWARGELDPVVLLPLSMGPWLEESTPRAIAFEQVPSVLSVWEAYADVLRGFGYSVWTGILDAAWYGVPQHRKRAVLMARWDKAVIHPAHTRAKPYVTVAKALGWSEDEVIAWSSGGTSDGLPARLNDQSGAQFDALWPFKRPALTIAGRNLLNHPGANANRFNGKTKSRNDGYWLTEQEMAVLQGFRRDYPFQGNISSVRKQIGNVVPPPMAAAVIGALL
jgi:DNA (cytosine-5)-methyltransferase 1